MEMRRGKAVAAAAVLALGGLGWRLHSLSTDVAAAVMDSGPRYQRSIQLWPVRGELFDRKGQPLRQKQWLTVVEPQYYLGKEGQKRLEQLLGQRVEPERLEKGKPVSLLCGRRVFAEGITQVQVTGMGEEPFPAIHLLGYTDQAGTQGLSGLEARYDGLLRCDSQWWATYRSDGGGHTMGKNAVEISREGQESPWGLRLTIDREMQEVVTGVLRQGMEKGCAVLLDARTGQVEAMESMPYCAPDEVEQLLDSREGELVNRAFCAYPVGSVFKLVDLCAAMEDASAGEWTTFSCQGSIDLEGVEIGCVKSSGHGELNMEQAFAVSCNPYFIQLAQRIGGERILQMAQQLGFGGPLPLGGELEGGGGELPSSKTLRLPAGLGNFAIGQGELLATPMQVASLVQAIAGGGVKQTINVVQGICDEQGNLQESLCRVGSQRVMSRETAGRLTALMRRVMTDGTGRKGEVPGLDICGKSSSAQGAGGQVHGWFVGFWPMEEPRHVLVVLCEDGGSGSGKALELFRRIAEGIEAL